MKHKTTQDKFKEVGYDLVLTALVSSGRSLGVVSQKSQIRRRGPGVTTRGETCTRALAAR